MANVFLPEPHLGPDTRSAESAEYINQLNPALPLGSDRIGQGDDHIRLIKLSSKNTFKNFVDANQVTYNQSILFSTTELNNLKNQINSINSKLYYIPQKTSYDSAPTSQENIYNFMISSDELTAGSGKRKISSLLGLPMLGEIFASILTEKKINEQYGVTYSGATPTSMKIFQVCNGANIATSKYGLLTSYTNCPNLITDGSFLAYLDDEPIKTNIADKSHPASIVSIKSTFNQNILNPHIQMSATHNHSVSGTDPSGLNTGAHTFAYNLRRAAGYKTTSSSTEAGPNQLSASTIETTGKGPHTHTVESDVPLTYETVSSKETRPKSYLVNYFMRIN